MATSAASKPFTVKGTRWMCTVRFVAFLLRQRGWAWVLIGINASRAVRMAAPRRRRGVVRSCAVRLPMPAASAAANASANASSSSKNKASPQAGLERPRAEGVRELLPSPSRAYPEAWGVLLCLLVSLQAASSQFEIALSLKRAHSSHCYTLQPAHSAPEHHWSHCRRKDAKRSCARGSK